jgi:hypothetical protein
VTVEAPASVPPGRSTQIKLTALYSNGTRTDVSNRTKWTSSHPDILQISEAGIATGVRDGESGVSGQFEDRSSVAVLLVLETGTFSARGTVTDGLLPVENARVDVLSGTGTGKSATSNEMGSFKLYGVAGQIDLRVSASGFHDLTRSVTVTSNQSISSFRLDSSNSPANIAGTWTLTLEAAGTCSGLPDSARKRTYTAAIKQEGTKLRVELSGADFHQWMNAFSGRILDNDVLLKLTTYEYYGPFFDLAERLDPNLDYTAVGTATGRATATSIATAFDGVIAVGPQRTQQTTCASRDHRMTLVRTTGTFP